MRDSRPSDLRHVEREHCVTVRLGRALLVQLHSWDLSASNSRPGETGWAVIDPGEVVAVVGDSEPKASAGQFL
jgi:hypothetical protein